MSVRIALIDSGVDAQKNAVASKLFSFDGEKVVEEAARPDIHGHGAALANTISALAPECEMVNAQVFADKMAASPLSIAAALDWSVGQGANAVNMSFGLVDDRDVLRKACERAIDEGVLLFAAAPARGGPVYPSAYPGVIRVSGDARLKAGEISILKTGGQADYGGCVVPGGASFAVAQIVGIAAGWLQENGGVESENLSDYLNSIARFDQPERRTNA